MPIIVVNEHWCKGCKLCAIYCPTGGLQMAGRLTKRGVHPPELGAQGRCNACRLCELVCPDFAITVTEDAGVKR